MSRTRELEEQIRAVLNEVVFSNLDDPTPVVDQVFRLSYDKWGELCQALDLLGDTELAIEYYLNFQEKSVEPTGNKYLQMYGVLNAAYLQMNSVTRLAELMALEGRSALNTAIKGLPIISSRSVLGAHTLSHNGKSFSVDRYSVGPHVVLRSDAYNTSFHNLPDELREFTNSIQEYLAKILLDFEKKGRNAQKLGVDRDGTCGIG